MRTLKWIRILLWEHPLFWIIGGIPLFMNLSRLPVNSWNVEMLIARNLLNGFGFVVGPLDPPALWRPPLAVAVLVPIEAFFRDPYLIYKLFGTLTLLGLMVATFYLMKFLGGAVAAHTSQLMLLMTPAVTVLVSRQLTFLAYLLVFSLTVLSILATLWSWQHASWRRDLLVGLCWGVAFLARPEVVLLFGVSIFSGALFHRYFQTTGGRAAARFALQAAAFLAIYVPTVLTFSAVQKRYDLIGQEPIMTFYAGAHFASDQLQGDPDGEGYMETVVRYGDPAKYKYSLVRFMIANPQAISLRVRQNLAHFKALIESHRVLNLWDCLAFVVLGSVLVLARPPSIPAFPLLSYLSLLVLASPYFLVFHPDARYPLLLVLTSILLLMAATLVFWTWVGSHLRSRSAVKLALLLPTVMLVVLCASRLEFAIKTARSEIVDLTTIHNFVNVFLDKVGSKGLPVVGFDAPDGTPSANGDFLWFSYFAGTQLPWCGNPDCYTANMFPRGRMYSYKGKFQDYVWVSDPRVKLLTPPYRIIAQHVPAGNYPYSLIQLGTK